MEIVKNPLVKTDINGCNIVLSFADKPVEGVMDNIQSILSAAYDERVVNELTELLEHK